MPHITLTHEELRILYGMTGTDLYWRPSTPDDDAHLLSLCRKVAEAVKAEETDNVDTSG